MFLSKSRKRSLKKSEYNTVFENLNSICSCLDKIYRINNGGCCYIAYIIADILYKEGIDYEVVVVPEEDSDLPDKFEDIKDSAYHVFIKVKFKDEDYLINSDDCSLEGDDTEYEARSYNNVTPEEILNYYNSFHWNWVYNAVKNKFIKYVINLLYDNFSSSLRERR